MATLRVPDRVGDLGSYLKEQREQARLSLRQLATAAGVSNPYLSQIERGLRRPSAEVLQQIARGLRISAEVLYVRAGILEDSQGLEVEVAIRTDPTLTERQRHVLLDIYATFQAENGRNSHLDAGTGNNAGAGSAVEPETALKPETAAEHDAAVEPDLSHRGGPAAPKSASSKAAARMQTARRTRTRSAAAPGPASGETAGSAGTAGLAGRPTAPTAR